MFTHGTILQIISFILFQFHFEQDQFELHRVDGKRKLRPFAVPTIFSYNPVPKGHRILKCRYPYVVASEHSYSQAVLPKEENESESKYL